MKLRIAILMVAVSLSAGVFAQNKATKDFSSNKKGQLFGIHVGVSDYITPQTFKTSPSPIRQSERKFPNIKDLSFGLGLSYWKGLTPKIDFAGTINTVFHDYAALYSGVSGTNEIGVELEPTINIRPIADNNRWAPFLTAGVGGGLYSNKIGAYVPVGGGLQLNWASTTYLFLKMQYHFALTKDVLKDNIYYSLGFAESFGPEDKPVPVVVPPIPVVEPPKDRDGDGVLDADDKCPDTKGLAALQGCPDRDGDGIADGDDNCPDVKGTAKYKGCPVPDTDGDGINDENDKCVNVAGVIRYQGCPVPDGDGDGVNDEEDKCPAIPGLASLQGCPEVKKEVKDAVDKAAKSIYFATGSAKLLSKSYGPLNSVVKMLKDNPDYQVGIEGNSDNTGTAARNQTLSEERAASVATYLKNKGIEESRISSKGNGQDNPIATNKTAAGRAKNRRVELKISY